MTPHDPKPLALLSNSSMLMGVLILLTFPAGG